MANITIRNLDDDLKHRLRMQAARHNRSMEAEVRHILQQALMPSVPPPNIADLALELFGEENGVELERHPPVSPQDIVFE